MLQTRRLFEIDPNRIHQPAREELDLIERSLSGDTIYISLDDIQRAFAETTGDMDDVIQHAIAQKQREVE